MSPPVEPPELTRVGEVLWLEPYPDLLLEGLADREPGPKARYETREAVSFAFVTALQLLPPRQRAVLILRDVLGFHAGEVAGILECTELAVTSALKRARSALEKWRASADAEPPPPVGSPAEQRLVARLARAFETGDVPGIVALLADDAWLTMPPLPLQYQGPEQAGTFLRAVAFRDGRTYRLVPTRANGQPAFAVYLRDPRAHVAHANGLLVLTLAGDRVGALTRFDNSALTAFGMPRLLPD